MQTETSEESPPCGKLKKKNKKSKENIVVHRKVALIPC
jgi:hypothetical protein